MANEHPGGRRNRLADEISPYLLQHQSNPVDWHPWGEEALSRARAEEKPIFLSVGYSTCYWCHVMERESFSDEATAELMNRFFINIKVDREERPDIDEIYMAATQLLTQHGGWPNSVFLTPDLKPFYAGTYFPPSPRHGLPAFSSVVQGLAEAWEKRRSDVLMQAEELEGAMRRFLEERGEPQSTVPSAEVARRSLELLHHRFDPRHGGFGGAPKFPTPANLYLLDALADEDPKALEMLSITLDRMARGGIYDQLAGGFHRYATDEAWLVPHFEKMLYDNALLLELYGRQAARSGDDEAMRIASEIVTFLEREMSAPEGGFWSALDAESDGHEGAYHVWSREQLDAELGEENSAFLAPILGFDDVPFFEGEYYVLHLPEPLAVQAERRRMGRDELLAELEPLKERLLAARQKRQPPRLDDKVLTDWNGMTIAGLAVAGHLLGDGDWIRRAVRAADFILTELRLDDGGLAHSWRLGQARIPAFLGDYVFLIRGLLALYEATAEDRWLHEAERLSEEQEARLADPQGGFHSVGEQEDVLFRSKEVFDGALPATNGVAILNLLELWRQNGEPRWLDAAERALKAFAMLISERPDGARMLALATRRYHDLRGQTARAHTEDAEDAGVVQARLSVEDADEDGWRPFHVEVAVREGWHVYAADVTAPLFATRLVARGGELRAVTFPDSEKKDLAGDGELVAIYEGSFTISGEVRGTAPEKAGFVLQAQPCTAARCLAPLDIALDL